jgi:hypothetical protein
MANRRQLAAEPSPRKTFMEWGWIILIVVVAIAGVMLLVIWWVTR